MEYGLIKLKFNQELINFSTRNVWFQTTHPTSLLETECRLAFP